MESRGGWVQIWRRAAPYAQIDGTRNGVEVRLTFRQRYT